MLRTSICILRHVCQSEMAHKKFVTPRAAIFCVTLIEKKTKPLTKRPKLLPQDVFSPTYMKKMDLTAEMFFFQSQHLKCKSSHKKELYRFSIFNIILVPKHKNCKKNAQK